MDIKRLGRRNLGRDDRYKMDQQHWTACYLNRNINAIDLQLSFSVIRLHLVCSVVRIPVMDFCW